MPGPDLIDRRPGWIRRHLRMLAPHLGAAHGAPAHPHAGLRDLRSRDGGFSLGAGTVCPPRPWISLVPVSCRCPRLRRGPLPPSGGTIRRNGGTSRRTRASSRRRRTARSPEHSAHRPRRTRHRCARAARNRGA
jgi:hypothetical protein